MGDYLPPGFFRDLSPEEVKQFTEHAQTQWLHQTVERSKLGIFHPVYRNEIQRLDMAKNIATEVCPACQTPTDNHTGCSGGTCDCPCRELSPTA